MPTRAQHPNGAGEADLAGQVTETQDAGVEASWAVAARAVGGGTGRLLQQRTQLRSIHSEERPTVALTANAGMRTLPDVLARSRALQGRIAR